MTEIIIFIITVVLLALILIATYKTYKELKNDDKSCFDESYRLNVRMGNLEAQLENYQMELRDRIGDNKREIKKRIKIIEAEQNNLYDRYYERTRERDKDRADFLRWRILNMKSMKEDDSYKIIQEYKTLTAGISDMKTDIHINSLLENAKKEKVG